MTESDGGDADVEVARFLVEEARLQYIETKNPLWAWQAISICLGRWPYTPPCKIPEWVETYLGDVAIGLLDLGMLLNPFSKPQREDYADQKSYEEALFSWRKAPVPLEDTLPSALKMLGLMTNKKGKNKFDLYKKQTNYLVMAIGARYTDKNKVVREYANKNVTELRAAEDAIRKGQKIRPRLKAKLQKNG